MVGDIEVIYIFEKKKTTSLYNKIKDWRLLNAWYFAEMHLEQLVSISLRQSQHYVDEKAIPTIHKYCIWNNLRR